MTAERFKQIILLEFQVLLKFLYKKKHFGDNRTRIFLGVSTSFWFELKMKTEFKAMIAGMLLVGRPYSVANNFLRLCDAKTYFMMGF